MKKIISLFFTIFLFQANAQNSKLSVGVMAFQSSLAQDKARAAQLQEIVLESLSSKSNIEPIDRSKDALLNKELDLQISERSIASKKLVEQGKKIGANHLIIGTLTSIQVTEEKAPSTSFLKNDLKVITNAVGNNSVHYKAGISFSLQIIDVETGTIISHRAFNHSKDNYGLLGMGTSKEESVVNAMKDSKAKILLWLNEVYPSTVKIVKIEEKTKSGKPKTILVTGIDEAYREGAKLILQETEVMPSGSDAPPLKRIRKIATLGVVEKQGDYTVCKVTDGEDLIEEQIGKASMLSIKEK